MSDDKPVDTAIESNRNLAGTDGKTELSKEVVVVAPYDYDTKTFKLWSDVMGIKLSDDNIWIGKQTFQDVDEVTGKDDIVINLADAAGAKKIIIKDSAGATILTIDSNGGIGIGSNQTVTFDDDEDTKVVTGDNTLAWTVGGNLIRSEFSTSTLYERKLKIAAAGWLEMVERSTDPGATAGVGKLYVKDDVPTKLYFQQDDGTVKEIAFV